MRFLLFISSQLPLKKDKFILKWSFVMAVQAAFVLSRQHATANWTNSFTTCRTKMCMSWGFSWNTVPRRRRNFGMGVQGRGQMFPPTLISFLPMTKKMLLGWWGESKKKNRNYLVPYRQTESKLKPAFCGTQSRVISVTRLQWNRGSVNSLCYLCKVIAS